MSILTDHKCHCTIIPPHMTERLNETIDDPVVREQADHAFAKHTQLRGKRALCFSGKTFNLPKAATDGQIIKIYDAKQRKTLPGTLVPDPVDSADDDISFAYTWALHTHNFFMKFFDRDSIDDHGMEIVSTVHYRKGYNNAFWNGTQMAYGDGDGKYFTSFTADSDITAHEMTHGVTQHTINLEYQGQSGALNESLSDVFGSMIKQYISGQDTPEADWLIGDKLLIGDKYALRSLSHPGTAYVDHPGLGTDPQPASMDAYNPTTSDNGGVHINSGIPNKAFYLASEKFYELDSSAYRHTWDGPGRVWYDARRYLSPKSDFVDFAQATVRAAEDIFGKESHESKQIRYAWADVKVLQHTIPTPPRRNSGCCTLL